MSGTLAAGDTARYTVTVGDDYYVFGEVNQISVDVMVRLMDSGGTHLGHETISGCEPQRPVGVLRLMTVRASAGALGAAWSGHTLAPSVPGATAGSRPRESAAYGP